MLSIFIQRSLKYSYRMMLPSLRRFIPRETFENYFAYGANLSHQRFEKNNILVEKTFKATLVDHTIKFNVPCEYKGQGYASVEHKDGSQVEGIVFLIKPQDLFMLDILEWVPFGFYNRVKKNVIDDDGNQIVAWCYEAKSPREELVPSSGYLSAIKKSAQLNQMTMKYTEHLNTFSSKDKFELDPNFCLWYPSKKRIAFKFFRSWYELHDRLREKLARLLP